MKKTLIVLLILVGMISCKQHNKFYISGTVKNAKGEMLYFEHSGLLKTTILDSVRVRSNGSFEFKSKRPVYPDFYRLRLNDKIITFAVDSCEEININAQSANFASDYKLTGSTTSNQIQVLRKSVMNIQRLANELTANMDATERNSKIAAIEKDIDVHKEMARKMILQNPRSAAAYFAIYQKVNDTYLFSPYIKSDRPYCAAVATAYNTFMPEYERSKNLYALVLDAIRSDRKAREKEAWDEILATRGTGYINIILPDKNNVERKLSALIGKVILIDFSAYESRQSIDYTFALRELYNQYHKRGFEIYQISLDQNKQLWQQSIANIPWICVRDLNGPNTNYVSSYNISSIPTTFLMDRKGNIIARSLGKDELRKAIEKNL
ncbi:MAG: thioredoxin-like domain-containing protein [Bacteroidota bacterium]|nr:thioredoxin-like domain-containing protein [Bacteroidota bacterium]